VAGYLDRYLTGTGFDIQPVVGLLADGFVLAPDPREVANVFEVPLAFLCDPANRRRETREIGDVSAAFMLSPMRVMRYGAPPPRSSSIWRSVRCYTNAMRIDPSNMVG